MKNLKNKEFEFNKLFFTIALGGALISSAANAVDFHGYVRSGISESTGGGQEAWLASKLGRFGNETDGWWGMSFSQDIVKTNDGKSMAVFSKLEGDTPLTGTDDWTYGDIYGGNGHMGLTEFYLTANGYIPAIPEASLWVGKRAYGNHEVQLLDYKPVLSSGNGFGIDGIKAGVGELSVGIKRNDQNSSSWTTTSQTPVYDNTGTQSGYINSTTSNSTKFNVDYVDVRYSKIPLVSDVTMEVIGQYAIVDKTDEQKQLISQGTIYDAENSFIPTVIISKPVGKGFNETYFQYGQKRSANNLVKLGYNDTYTTTFDDNYSNANAYRIINDGETYLSDNVVMAHAIAYSAGSDITPTLENVHSFNVVARPAYIWTQNHKTAVELGWFKQVNTVSGVDKEEMGKKVTLAHIISAGPSAFARPDFRFYTTYIKADKNEIDNMTFNNGKNSQVSFGVQVEAWW
ncbi:carbohydrate porin [uncultured Tolumonas sp.]|uniref:carbohydrate porin n=1 Tax=uncultured Tolumonas sp. TaxID=263765 RepID=UPI00292D3CE0|nr:carbohydrate porin [uncultured Tolumonas sp.]